MNRRSVRIGDRTVGDGEAVYIVFDAGATITGVDSAKTLVEASAQSGVDALKFQCLYADTLMSDEPIEFSYKTLHEGEVKEDLKDIIRRRELSFDEWREVAAYSDQRGVTFFSTPQDEAGADMLLEAGSPCLKIMGGDMTHLPFIRYVAESGVPVLLDTRGTLGEIEKAVETCIRAGNEDIVIVYSPSGYPATTENIRLLSIALFRNVFPYPIGFSDHSPGRDMNVAALALGANFIEKTITLSRDQRSAEHSMSIEPDDLRSFVSALREVEVAMGVDSWQALTEMERSGLAKARRSVITVRDLPEGHRLTREDLDFARPATGVAPDMVDAVVGRRLNSDHRARTVLRWEDLSA